MTTRQHGSWTLSKDLARGILHDRSARRSLLARLLCVILAILVAGLWGIDRWLMADLWRFVIWWGACTILTCLLALLALYDMLAVVREEREKIFPPNDSNFPPENHD